MDGHAQAGEVWAADDAPSCGWPLDRNSDASMLLLQSLLTRAEELHMDMHHALQVKAAKNSEIANMEVLAGNNGVLPCSPGAEFTWEPTSTSD